MTSKPMLATGAAAFALLAMGADSCSTETKSTPDSPSSDKQSSSSPAKAKSARVGDVITLNGQEDGSKVAIRLLKIIDPVTSSEFDQAPAGHRYIGVQVRLSNQGTTTYSDSPSNGATLIMSGDEQAESTLLAEGSCSGQFSSSAKISPGTRQTGCIAFEAAKSKKPKRFQFTLDSGFGPATGEWTIKP
jgi:Domain of unknown function (DUF4352)